VENKGEVYVIDKTNVYIYGCAVYPSGVRHEINEKVHAEVGSVWMRLVGAEGCGVVVRGSV
jgi:hypothetical protein